MRSDPFRLPVAGFMGGAAGGVKQDHVARAVVTLQKWGFQASHRCL